MSNNNNDGGGALAIGLIIIAVVVAFVLVSIAIGAFYGSGKAIYNYGRAFRNNVAFEAPLGIV